MSHASRAALRVACEHVGPGAHVRGRPVLENLGRITIGQAFTLDASPVSTHLVTGPGATLDIGDRVSIAHGVGITAHVRVHIGNDVVVGAYAMILDTDFHVVGDRGASPECTPIHIGDGVTIGAHVTVLRGAVIGAGASVAPGSVVAGHVPPGTLVGGNPARPLMCAPEQAADPDDAATAGPTHVTDAVPTIVARTLGLALPPDLGALCATIPGWDSLGMLNILLSLEAAFDLELHPDAIVRVRRVQDLVDLVDAHAELAHADGAPLEFAR